MFEGIACYNVLREHPHNVTIKVMGVARWSDQPCSLLRLLTGGTNAEQGDLRRRPLISAKVCRHAASITTDPMAQEWALKAPISLAVLYDVGSDQLLGRRR